jgi:hypothetical protein
MLPAGGREGWDYTPARQGPDDGGNDHVGVPFEDARATACVRCTAPAPAGTHALPASVRSGAPLGVVRLVHEVELLLDRPAHPFSKGAVISGRRARTSSACMQHGT